jgi:hypothetical protein
VGFQGVSHDVIDNTGRRNQFTVESAWEDRAFESGRSFGERVYLETLILIIILDFHCVLDKQRTNMTRRLEIFSVADLSSFREMAT